jgi:anti-sigma factor RsiW
MLKCFFTQRKIVDYLEDALSSSDKTGFEAHMNTCAACRKVLNKVTRVIRIAGAKRSPQLSEEYWKKFDTDLNTRLDERLAVDFRRASRPVLDPFVLLRHPAWVAVSLAVIVLAVGLKVLPYARRNALAQQEEASLISDVDLLDEIGQANGASSGQDENVESELELLYSLDLEQVN